MDAWPISLLAEKTSPCFFFFTADKTNFSFFVIRLKENKLRRNNFLKKKRHVRTFLKVKAFLRQPIKFKYVMLLRCSLTSQVTEIN